MVPPEVEALIRQHYRPRTPGAVAKIVALLGWPRWKVTQAIAALKLTGQTWVRWTPEQDRFLMDHAGEWPPGRISYQMQKQGLGCRSVRKIVERFKVLEIPFAVKAGYSTRDVADCFGVSQTTVLRWVRLGYLKPTENSPVDSRGNPRFTDTAILRFVRTYRQEFSLAKVSQHWFLGLVFPAGGMGDADG